MNFGFTWSSEIRYFAGLTCTPGGLFLCRPINYGILDSVGSATPKTSRGVVMHVRQEIKSTTSSITEPQSQELIAMLRPFFETRPEALLVYLFGSRARGEARATSDIDIALLVDDSVNPADYARYRLNLWGELTSHLHRNDIDIVVLNNAPVLLRHRVLRDGKLVLCRNENRRVQFTVKTGREFWDTSYLRRLSLQYMEKHIRMGTFGKPIAYRRLDD